MEADVLSVLLLTLILHASVAYLSIIFVFKKKSGELRNYVEGPEMKQKLVNWFSGMLNEEIEFDGQKGKIIDLAGDVAVGKCLAFVESDEGKQMMAGILDAAGAVVTQRVQEWLGGHIGQINKDIKGMGDEGLEAVAGSIHPLLGAAAATKAGKKFLREPLVQSAIPLVAQWAQQKFMNQGGNGGNQPIPSAPSNAGGWA